MKVRVEKQIGSSIFSLETGYLAKQAHAAVLAQYGETVVMNAATAVITEKSPYIVRVSLTLPMIGETLGTWAVKKGGVKKVYTMVTDFGPGLDAEAAFQRAFKAAGGRAIPLNVSAPFHSRYMRDAEEEFTAFVRTFDLSPPSIPVISNATARPYEAGAMVETLAKQIGSSVRWLDSILYMLDQGVTEFEEVGPGTVLTKLTAQIQKARNAS